MTFSSQNDQILANANAGFGDSDIEQSDMSKAAKKPVVESFDMPDDNPISAMMALKHPERQREIENMQTNEMAQSHYGNYVTTY